MNAITRKFIISHKGIIVLLLASLCTLAVQSADWRSKYRQHPLIIVGDWDKPPYEFLDDDGEPAGTNIDLLRTLCKELDIPCRFILKEWSGALKAFERGDADIILANSRRYRTDPYVCSENIINYNRICAATCIDDSTKIIDIATLIREGVVLKPADYTALFFRRLDSLALSHVEYQSPKVALQGLLDGDYKYFCWGEEPLRWKINNLKYKGIKLCEVEIPVSEIHIVGRDRNLIYQLDDLYSRLKQSGEVQRINDRWMHPERVQDKKVPPTLLYAVIGAILVAALLYFFSRLAKLHVKRATRSSTELKDTMFKALKMGSFHIMEYDIKRDLMTNRYGTSILPPQGITLEEFTEHIHPREREEFIHKMEALLNGRERKFELRKRWRAYQDGEHWLYLDGHAMVENDKDGHPAIIFNAIHDITRDEEAEREIYETECKYKTLFNMPTLAISFYDSDGALLDLNDRMREICGITPDTPDNWRYWSTVRLFDIPLIRSVYKSGEEEELLACMYMKYKDLGLDNCVEYHVQPLFDKDGKVINYYVTTVDITSDREQHVRLLRLDHEKTHTEKRINQQKDWLQYLLQKSDRYIMQSSIAKNEISFYRKPDKPEFVHQTDDFCDNILDEKDGMPFRELITDSQTRTARQHIIHLKKQPKGQPGTVFQQTFWPVTNSKGNIVGHEGISADITALVNARQRLADLTLQAKDSVRLKSGFMASMTHELRTPLNAIIGFTGVLEDLQDSADRAEYVRIIQNSSDMMQRLLSDITQASSIGDGPSTLEYTDVNFSRSFDDICFTMQHRVQNPEVRFIKENNYESLNISIDVGRVQQVITNFVTNAVKFTPEGYIRLGYRYERGGIYVYCEDTGLGIPEDKQQIIFDRFVKLDEFVQGTGMGLAISKSIIEHMGGNIGVSSLGKGRGSIFWFWVPCERKLKV